MTDILRKAVELADGWEYEVYDQFEPTLLLLTRAGGGYLEGDWSTDLNDMEPVLKDALAAQLVRQVNAEEGYRVQIGDDGHKRRAMVFGPKFRAWRGYMLDNGDVDGPDRTMNSLTAIIESKVLE